MWLDGRARVERLALVPVLLAVAVLTAGCFQPLYGETSLASGGSTVRAALNSVDVEQIVVPEGASETKLAVQIRNDLVFNFTGGGTPGPAAYRLRVRITSARNTVAVNQVTNLPNIENYVLTASYSLNEIGTNRTVVNGNVATTASYDPSGTQRFARISALQDSERRAAKVIAENITTRLASYFISGS
jgi:LPS-assembly lipoprotein